MTQFLDEDFHLIALPESVRQYQYGHRLLAHGKICPWCKEYMMTSKDAVLVYRIPLRRVKDRGYKASVYFHKLNWDYVCSEVCQRQMVAKWIESIGGTKNLAERIAQTPTLKIIEVKISDDYRDRVLKLCRIDPRLDLTTKAFNPVTNPVPVDTLFT